MALNDRYEVAIYGSVNAQQTVNVFHYEQTAGSDTPSAELIAEEVIATVLPVCAAIMNSSANFSSVRCVNIDDDTDFFEGAFTPIPGDRTGEVLPPYACWSFKLVRPVIGIRPGAKRFAGVSESDQSAGVAVGGLATALDAVADILATVLTPGGNSYDPGILSRYLNGEIRGTVENPTPVMFTITSAQYVGIGTQNSRKIGRGS